MELTMTEKSSDAKLKKTNSNFDHEANNIANYINIRNFLVQTLNDLTIALSKEQRKTINAKIIELGELILTLTFTQDFSGKLLQLKYHEAEKVSSQ